MNFEERPETTVMVEKVYCEFAKLERGETVYHESIIKIIGFNPHEGPWDNVVNKARKRLEQDQGISTLPVNGVGYMLATPSQQLALPNWRMRRAIRQIRKGRKSVQSLPQSQLSAHQARLRLTLMDQSRAVESKLRKEARLQADAMKSTPTIAQRPLPQMPRPVDRSK